MKVVESISGVRTWRGLQRQQARRVGFVPTMGFLHEGHLSLVRRARDENEAVAASIFVNPSQFDRRDDLANYPRDLDRDLDLLSDAGCDAVFVPTPDEIYPPGFQTWVEVGQVSEPLEGAHRPGHFRGVATVVAKLFGIVEPTQAYFGQKDAQQLAVIRVMVRDLNLPVEVVGCPTVREADGLAMSSRNSRLGPDQRQAATVLHRALNAARDEWLAGMNDSAGLRDTMRAVLETEPMAETEYVSVADPLTMTELEAASEGAVLSMAVRVGPVRLIDNILLERQDNPAVVGSRADDVVTTRGTT